MAPELQGAWAEVIARCLRRDPAQRYSSASDAVRHLQSGRRPLVLPTLTRRQWLLAGGAAAAVVGMALIPVGLRFYRDRACPP